MNLRMNRVLLYRGRYRRSGAFPERFGVQRPAILRLTAPRPKISIREREHSRMATMDGFDHILNWTLRVGSHPFPGKDGGTCINEAALVAAGFAYQRVKSIEDMPACFSRPICRLAMRLNDAATDKERQRLLPFVTRLACADSPEVERERATYIHGHTARRFPFQEGLEVLEGALAIGRQADALGLDTVKTRMGAVQGRATMDTSVADADNSLFSKIKGWFGAAKQSEPAA